VIEVIRLAGAEADIQAAFERLEEVREGAGDRFLRELDRCASFSKSYKSLEMAKVISSETLMEFPRRRQA
jgi:hypothetical protein